MVSTGDIGDLQETGTRTCTIFFGDKEKDRRSSRGQGEPSDDDGGLMPGREGGGRCGRKSLRLRGSSEKVVANPWGAPRAEVALSTTWQE